MEESRRDDSLSNVAEYSVSEISLALKRTVEDTFGHVRVRGEISGFRGRHSSGHCYFTLKDDRARLEAVIWKTTFAKLRFPPQEGLEVIATGRLTTYPGSSKYQIVIESLEPAGAGALMALLEERKRRLAAEGLFAEERKKPLPFLPRVIGVITSPTGAVIRDIIHRITDRFPVRVVVWPVRVQGETTGAEVATAISGFNALSPDGAIARPDLLIVARGGGSLEDLWGFNDEAVVRATATSAIPLISAVGHETDWTLIDLAADRRAPTPTGAAEMAVPVKAELEANLARLSARLRGAISRDLDRRRQESRSLARALPSPDQLFALPRRRFDEAAGRLARALETATQRKRLHFNGMRLSIATLDRRLAQAQRDITQCGERLPIVYLSLVRHRRARFDRDAARISPRANLQRISILAERLKAAIGRKDRAVHLRLERARVAFDQTARLAESLSYKSVLDRGFALVRDAEDRPVKRAGDVKPGEALSLQFADDSMGAIATGKSSGVGRKGSSSPKEPGKQGSLF
ncbi:exodeoxyribonuclease VII large subunit [Chelativorans sp. AA-79]|uniref:exodeoxyribonuclease VII large subunit n=1 Tax=Chelativorans sp. AA-79 TaxID=3028735 RepID=UPI0023F940AB|nr:exodeoxyribonuclease VII large subunit [Chelativorans sp. AA-79]WEX08807.1 exodeoxyribonuclease VII large subunit [Chelativorans sp. AA-79]